MILPLVIVVLITGIFDVQIHQVEGSYNNNIIITICSNY